MTPSFHITKSCFALFPYQIKNRIHSYSILIRTLFLMISACACQLPWRKNTCAQSRVNFILRGKCMQYNDPCQKQQLRNGIAERMFRLITRKQIAKGIAQKPQIAPVLVGHSCALSPPRAQDASRRIEAVAATGGGRISASWDVVIVSTG